MSVGLAAVVCPQCGAEAPPLAPAAWGRCPSCASIVFAASGGPQVLIVHDSEPIATEIGRVLAEEGMHPLHARDGDAGWTLLTSHEPAGTVLDVGLNYPTAFELTDRIRTHEGLRHTKVVLLASVFNNTAYKRRPKTLYGADDYVEQHHIPDMLPAKLASLLQLERRGRLADVREVAERVQAAQARAELHGKERVRVLARAVVSDIALYFQEEIAAVKEGEVAASLVVALAEGRRVLAELAHHEEYPSPDPVRDAFEELLAGRRASEG